MSEVESPTRAESAWSRRLELFLASRPGIGITVAIALCALFAASTVTLTPNQQLVVAFVYMVVFFVVGRKKTRHVQVFLEVLSAAVSLRYLTWRLTDTLYFDTWIEIGLGTFLLTAELYALVMLFLTYFQTIYPLGRAPIPLPDNARDWPTVDVYIPTYNEDLSIVRLTILGALGIDWPRDKLNVYVLDDGKREEFARFAEECGVAYIARPINEHAKAGNFNYALKRTSGEFILTLDSDHIPTRAFLQLTMGWMIGDPKIALMQTPHHFYSPDPFQRNLATGFRTPPESNLFYGVVQDGNDFWDATFFCGSCAILRREAIEGIGGFATQTVTEDAHTALRMQRQGWSTAYLRIPLAGGLATERLITHIGQRVRWARGMLQIFRIDNPLLGPGLNWGQRLCYLSAMISFLFAVPRVVFLTSPLAFLFFGQNIITASPLAVLAYAVPHMLHAIATASRINKGWRYSFWSEVYETTMALFLVRVTIATLLRPRRARFNVTNKGGVLESGYFDLRAVYPNIILGIVMLIGLSRGIYGLFFEHVDFIARRGYLLNSLWAAISLLIILAAIAVGRETQQKRYSHRIRAELPVSIMGEDGVTMNGMTEDLSMGGASVSMNWPHPVTAPQQVDVRVGIEGEQAHLRARVIRSSNGKCVLQWDIGSIPEEASIVRIVFGRADAWMDWNDYRYDQPLRSVMEILINIKGLFYFPRRRRNAGAEASYPSLSEENVLTDEGTAGTDGAQRRRKTGLLSGTRSLKILPLLACLSWAASAQAASSPSPASAPVSTPAPVPASDADTDAAAAEAAVDSGENASGAGEQMATTHTYTLEQLGAPRALTMRSNSPLQGLEFGVPADRLVTSARLIVSGAMSPSLRPETSAVTITLNEQYVGTLRPTPSQPAFGPIAFDVNPIFFVNGNRLNFNFAAGTQGCADPTDKLMWATISQNSQLQVTTIPLPPRRQLSRLPQPFFDKAVDQQATIPMVLAASYDSEILTASSIVASWFGKQTDFRGVTFPVSSTIPQRGNAVAVGVVAELPAALGHLQVNGPTVLELANPSDANGTVLVVTGRDRDEVITASKGLGFGSATLPNAPRADIAPIDLAPSRPNDAPAFIPTNRPVKLGELVPPGVLQGVGYTPGIMSVPFRVPPDLYTWHDRPYKMDVRFRSPDGPIVDVSRSHLDVGVNDVYVRSYSLRDDSNAIKNVLEHLGLHAASGVESHIVSLPPWLIYGKNQLHFYFDAMPMSSAVCRAGLNVLHLSVDPDSTINFSNAFHITTMPNLAYLASAGYPFTTYADLSRTAVVLPDHPSASTISVFMDLMGFMGASSWYPVAGVEIVTADHVSDVADRNLIVLSTLGESGDISPLLANSAYQISDGRLHMSIRTPLGGIWNAFRSPLAALQGHGTTEMESDLTGGVGAMMESQSPLMAGRTVLALLSADGQGLNNLIQVLESRKDQPQIQGDLLLVHGDTLSTYRSSPLYTVGSLPLWMWPDWYMHNHPSRVLVLGLFACVLLTAVMTRALVRHATRRYKELQDQRRTYRD
ncbi:UDP-forming cellulose synthase catalytic subunit [Komagataeibacter saccharivorans]|uniref:UDP-forming cellulose synthase catalytic subunit n=1 Tax=Komagataeibacter saccharivorans TaxID=265959 RepID=UPI0039ED04FC